MSGAPLPRYVLDASVAVKWLLNDEDFAAESLALLTNLQEDRIALIAPDHIRYEVASALRNATRMDRISADDSHHALTRFLDLRIPTIGSDALIVRAHGVALRLGCAFYDGLYLALAETSACPLIFADRRFRNSLGGGFELALWIEDYR